MSDFLPKLIDEDTREVLRRLYEQHARLMYKCEADGARDLAWYHNGAMTAVGKVQALLEGDAPIITYIEDWDE